MHTNSDSTFVKHEGCDACGSSDANAVYSNGSKFCYACETRTPPPNNKYAYFKPERPINTDITLTKDVELERLVSKWAAAHASRIPERNITSTYAKKYGVIVDGDKHYYPYFNSESS